MKKIILIIVSVMLLGFLTLIGLRIYTKSFSPEAQANFAKNDFKMDITYCRPYKKDRLIFGDSAQNALVPYNQVWRTGANEATIITFNKDIQIGDVTLKPGSYSLFSVPQKNDWKIIFNEETGQWGTRYNAKKDIVQVAATSHPMNEMMEQFLISFRENDDKIFLVLQWDKTEVELPFTIN